MAKRYGRNQKRQAREAIADLTAKLDTQKVETENQRNRAWSAEARARDAYERAAQDMVRNIPETKHAIEHIVDRLVEHYTPELEKVARQVLDSMARHRRTPYSLSFDAHVPVNAKVTHVSGEIPAARYTVIVGGF